MLRLEDVRVVDARRISGESRTRRVLPGEEDLRVVMESRRVFVRWAREGREVVVKRSRNVSLEGGESLVVSRPYEVVRKW